MNILLNTSEHISVRFDNGQPVEVVWDKRAWKTFKHPPYLWLCNCANGLLQSCGFKVKVDMPTLDDNGNHMRAKVWSL